MNVCLCSCQCIRTCVNTQVTIKKADGSVLTVGQAWAKLKNDEIIAMPREMMQAMDVALKQVCVSEPLLRTAISGTRACIVAVGVRRWPCVCILA